MALTNRYSFAFALATLGFVASGGVQGLAQVAASQESAKSAEVSIPFINHGGVRDWQAVGDDKLYIQDSGGKWYLATLAAPSPDLAFATAIGFETKGADRLDRFGTLVIAGNRYPLASLVASSPPPPRKK
ncbi:DUF6491 family protein [Sphingobium lignivorans]|uniref:Uncharacterized protein n=1 Tax=Sphingobium lignivorans TaxID=2735886 RepID=A0ABR6NCW4_9SPHN|nr:DUF6491 family protein [Sphingobium lignivorans]MBB5985129.1 hypothetical protein [Sphingobium lignivorans]